VLHDAEKLDDTIRHDTRGRLAGRRRRQNYSGSGRTHGRTAASAGDLIALINLTERRRQHACCCNCDTTGRLPLLLMLAAAGALVRSS